jgi:Flp pilus assembly pilin Flp
LLAQRLGRLFRSLSSRLRDESGQSLVEYALIAALVAVVGVTALGVLSGKFNGILNHTDNTLTCPSGYHDTSSGVVCNAAALPKRLLTE